jgi:hypothetical protein
MSTMSSAGQQHCANVPDDVCSSVRKAPRTLRVSEMLYAICRVLVAGSEAHGAWQSIQNSDD